MSTQTPTPVSVFPNPVPFSIIPLPDDYPRLPITAMNFQPVAYTQGIATVSYVTVLVPLLPKQIPVPPQVIYMTDDDAGITFTYTIQIATEDTVVDADRLALMSFSFLTQLAANKPFKVAIAISPLLPTNQGQGKVVMDSNMDPTLAP